MAVSPGNSSSTNSGTGTGSSLTWAHTVAPGSNLLLIGIATESPGATTPTATGVTYNGVACTKLQQLNTGYSPPETEAELWYMLNPPTGSAYNIVVSLSGACRSAMGASDFSGVDTGNPFGTVATYAPATTIAQPVVLVPGLPGQLLVDMLAKRSNDVPVCEEAQTQLWNNHSTYTTTVTSNATGSSSYRPAVNTTTQMTWTLPAARSLAYIGVALNPLIPLPPYYSVLQPDETAGKDAFITGAGNAGTNFGTSGTLYMGTATNAYRSLIQFDLSSIPRSAIVRGAWLQLTVNSLTTSNARTLSVYRLKTDWDESQVTWNSRKTGTAWTTAGAFDPADCEQVAIGSIAVTTTEYGMKSIPLDIAKIQEIISGLFTNNGFLLRVNTEVADRIGYDSSSGATPENRPFLTISYDIGGRQFQAIFMI